MNLPIPNAQRVEEFKQMYLRDFGVELTQQEAFDALSDLAAIVYLLYYEPVRPLRGSWAERHRNPPPRNCPTSDGL